MTAASTIAGFTLRIPQQAFRASGGRLELCLTEWGRTLVRRLAFVVRVRQQALRPAGSDVGVYKLPGQDCCTETPRAVAIRRQRRPSSLALRLPRGGLGTNRMQRRGHWGGTTVLQSRK